MHYEIIHENLPVYVRVTHIIFIGTSHEMAEIIGYELKMIILVKYDHELNELKLQMLNELK